ncbi:MAG: hypothetical protein H6757_06470 [Candidatus Omnitrophica bacterium]|nr:hypothetical protein [Candidatus Omnitrophota bacterium]
MDAPHTSHSGDSQLIERLKISNHQLEMFALSASHDLREPVRNISRFVQLLKRQCAERLTPAECELLDTLERNAERLTRMIRETLASCRFEKKDEAVHPVLCSKIIAQVLEDLNIRIEEKKVSVFVGELPVIQANEISMKRVFQNLLINAIKFCDDHTPEIRVRLIEAKDLLPAASESLFDVVDDNEAFWIFEIHNNGISISPDHAPRIFELFYRGNASDSEDGTGLGLWICHRLLEIQGGKIAVLPSSEGGTSAFFTLPKH